MRIFRRKPDEENFRETIEILKGLEKIKTPDNFEYNLMVKIRNQEFTTSASEEKGIRYAWIIPPAAAVVLTSVVLFFILIEQTPEMENPLLSPPTLRHEYLTIQESRRGPVEYVAKETSESVASVTHQNDDVINEVRISREGENNIKVVLQPNDVIIRKKTDFPFNKTANVDLDSYIVGSGEPRNPKSNARLVRESEGYPVFDFDGFFIREEMDRHILEKYRNRIDSLRSARIKK